MYKIYFYEKITTKFVSSNKIILLLRWCNTDARNVYRCYLIFLLYSDFLRRKKKWFYPKVRLLWFLRCFILISTYIYQQSYRLETRCIIFTVGAETLPPYHDILYAQTDLIIILCVIIWSANIIPNFWSEAGMFY